MKQNLYKSLYDDIVFYIFCASSQIQILLYLTCVNQMQHVCIVISTAPKLMHWGCVCSYCLNI